tara:strand:- start:783 stop:1100 length:318 start_codon:yes stop_codon:yes gene_type:complete
MEEVISNFENKLEKIKKDFNLIKPLLANNFENDDYYKLLDELVNLKNNLDNTIESIVNIKTIIYKNNLELLDLENKREIQENMIQEKINSIIKPLMLCLMLKFSE